MTRFGQISVVEQMFSHKNESNRIIRPFSQAAKVRCGGYSIGLERAATDFAADGSFNEAVQKIAEHYGIEVNASRLREIAEKHGEALKDQSVEPIRMPVKGVKVMIAEMDGSHIPCVEFSEGEGDQRKRRKSVWHEAKLCLARVDGKAAARYGATMGGIEQAGPMWRRTAIEAGAGRNTYLHCLGDGATSIARQAHEQFGKQGKYLLDYYHVSEYLAAAGQRISGESGVKAWLGEKQALLKENQADLVIGELRDKQEPKSVVNDEAVVRKAYRYLSEREKYLDYKGALEQGLPIGSGEIEAGHRSVVQARLKISGAWWNVENAEKILALRVCRANEGEWELYWQGVRQANR